VKGRKIKGKKESEEETGDAGELRRQRWKQGKKIKSRN